MTTIQEINVEKIDGEYQPLASYSAKQSRGGGSREEGDRKANAAARQDVEQSLAASGFRQFDGEWYSSTCYARVVADYRGGTIGVEISRNAMAQFATHQLDGTYDSLPLPEKHRLSGAGGTIESWLLLFDRCGKPRPGDGAK